jgi:uncharacterized short protein YbdD (DUF466 family)
MIVERETWKKNHKLFSKGALYKVPFLIYYFMIKTNSELPITLLHQYNEKLNDFDLVLFHLYISEPTYRDYFNMMRETHPERTMILDNSAYEFFVKGEELDLDEYEKAIIDLNPDYYILPDVLMDKVQTVTNILKFQKSHQRNIEKYFENTEEGAPQPIAVAQGKTIDEFNSCLTMLFNMGYNNIAIPFHNSFFKEEFDECDGEIAYEFALAGYQFCTEDVRYAMGRCMWMKKYGLGILSPDGSPKYTMLHFLGSHCPAEKKYLKTLFSPSSNVSMDTGYPVKCAIKGEILGQEKGKPNIIIDEFMLDEFSIAEQRLIEDNVNTFRNY